jgi:cytochrome c biogenesis protein CcdA
MADSDPALAVALWLGVLTSVSPCPLATNIAALSYLGRQVGQRRQALLSAGAYILGRSLTYVALGALIVAGLAAIPPVSAFLERTMNRLLGPVLILVGMALLDLLPLPPGLSVGSQGLRESAARSGALGALFLGLLFALSFCPVSAALFFGSLVPLAIQEQSPVLLPIAYGLGTGLPVIVPAILFVFGIGALGAFLQRMESFQRWALRATGLLFIAIGIYFVLRFIFGWLG